MNQIPDALYCDQETTTWVVVGASRGIGLEFVRQLIARGEKIIATVRQPSFDEFAFHLHTNTIGPIITAQKLLQTNIPIGTIVFMSSDSGSAINFREMEDGYCQELC
ncbi:putative short-chain dehydrogenase reductase [Diplodia seriata]|uniref:Putative short-chain dehydrogenase reductase n=1 Tax=Diplodia seriata TaxID=420778 RepID=A0A0G2EJC0_9PEZI|nr:putative short-chain dehydrogenase reductase [Diplodia seriata]